MSTLKHKVKGVILCGGEGKRLRPLTYYFQKTMIPIGVSQKPLLEYIVKLMRHHNIRDIVLLVGYKYEQITNYFGDGSRFNVRLTYVLDDPDMKGTGGALLNAYLKGVFEDIDTLMIYYGDILSNINLSRMLEEHWRNSALATLAVATKYQIPVGVAKLDDNNRIIDIVEKPWLDIPVGIGILALEYKALDKLKELSHEKKDIDIMGDLLPKLVRENEPVHAYKHDGFWLDVGSTEKYEKIDNKLVSSIFKDII